MAAVEPLYYLFQETEKRMPRNEILLFEVMLFLKLEPALNKMITNNQPKECTMMENNFVKNLIEDILSTEEYSLSGIAYHLNLPEKVLADILVGYNQSPSLAIARKIMELHKSVRRDLYDNLIKKIVLHAMHSEN